MIFSQHKETYEVLLDYPKIRGENIKYFVETFIRNLFHANIDVHSRRLFDELPEYGIKCIEKLQSHCTNMTFYNKSRYDRIFQQVTDKGRESAINYIKIFQNVQALSVLLGNTYSEDQLMHRFLDNFHQGGKYSNQIASHQGKLRREESFTGQ